MRRPGVIGKEFIHPEWTDELIDRFRAGGEPPARGWPPRVIDCGIDFPYIEASDVTEAEFNEHLRLDF